MAKTQKGQTPPKLPPAGATGSTKSFLFPFTGGPRVAPVPTQRPRFKETGAQGRLNLLEARQLGLSPRGVAPVSDRVGPVLGPLKSTGLPVDALAFTGRGVAMVISAVEFAPNNAEKARVKVGPVPFRGFVRDFNIIDLGVDDSITYMPVYSRDDDTTDLVFGDDGSDTPLVIATPERLPTAKMPGYGFFIGGSHPLASPNYLLPPGSVWLGVWVANVSVGSVVAEFSFEVLEVVE